MNQALNSSPAFPDNRGREQLYSEPTHRNSQRRFRSLSPEPYQANDTDDIVKKEPRVLIVEDPPTQPKRLPIDYQGSLNTKWTPFFLRKWVLSCFALLCAGVIAALQLLYTTSQAHKGIVGTDSNKHFLWTYGPTAFFVLVTVFWRQVDYAAKHIQPWAELAKGPVSAEKSLLLDYVNPLHVIGLARAFKNGHVAPAATISLFFLIKAITIVSTGLFDLETVQRDSLVHQMAIENVIDGSNFKHAGASNQRAEWEVYANLKYSLDLPRGVSDQYAVQVFSPSQPIDQNATSYTATVDAFTLQLDCEDARVYYNQTYRPCGQNTSTDMAMSYDNRSYIAPSCQISYPTVELQPGFLACAGGNLNDQPAALMSQANCTGSGDQRLLLEYTVFNGIGPNQTVSWNAIICNPTYAVRKALATLDPSGQLRDLDLQAGSRQLQNITAMEIVTPLLDQSTLFPERSDTDVAYDVVPVLMRIATPSFQPDYFANNSFLKEKASAVFARYGAQFANDFLISSTNSSDATSFVEGSVVTTQQRLLVQILPTRIMQGISGAMLLFVLLLLALAPRNVTPKNMESIASIATVLLESQHLVDVLHDTGHQTAKELAVALSPHRFNTSQAVNEADIPFSVRVAEGTKRWDAPQDAALRSSSWAVPLILRRWAMIVLIAAPLVTAAGLEVLQRMSDRNHGLMEIESNSLSRLGWLYVPTLILVSIATLFNMLDFELKLILPFLELSKQFQSRESLFWTPSRHLPIFMIFQALTRRRYALSAISVAVLLAPLLTIVASGLFFMGHASVVHSTTATTSDWFAVDQNITSELTVAEIVVKTNTSFPKWTYDELVFPTILATNNDTAIDLETSKLSVNTPALRAKSNCTLISRTQMINVTIEDDLFSAIFPLTDSCKAFGHLSTFQVSSPTVDGGYFGGTVSDFANSTDCNVHRLLFYGHRNGPAIDYFQAYQCTNSLDILRTNLTLNMADNSVSTKPTIDETSVRHFSDWHSEASSVMNDIDPISIDKFDYYLNLMVQDRDSVSTDSLRNPNIFIAQQQHVYRQLMAQVLNALWRAPNADFSAAELATAGLDAPLNANQTGQTGLRILQSQISTRILQGILGVLAICGIIVISLVDARQILPKPVGSIAAIASLIADSRIVDPKSRLTPAGSDRLNDEQMQDLGIWKDEKFKLGWWTVNNDDDTNDKNVKGLPCSAQSERKSTRSKEDANDSNQNVLLKRRRYGIDSTDPSQVKFDV